MDAGLASALRDLQDQLQRAADAATDGEPAIAVVLFTQVGMTLGMHIGHFRVTLGARFPSSPECAALNKAAQLLNWTIVAAFSREKDEEDEDEDDKSPEPSAPAAPYGYSASVHEEDE
ncbi:MAG: hypothetical protein EBS48_09805 [Actinobacteria bacterium]|nr:hypothetical protein [Actinomycetota bacterium]